METSNSAAEKTPFVSSDTAEVMDRMQQVISGQESTQGVPLRSDALLTANPPKDLDALLVTIIKGVRK